MFYRREGDKHTVVAVATDDMAVTSKRKMDVEKFKKEIKKHWDIVTIFLSYMLDAHFSFYVLLFDSLLTRGRHMLFISASTSLAATCAEGYLFISVSSLHAATLQYRHAFTLPLT